MLGLSIQRQQEQIARISPQVAFTEADLAEQIDSIKKKEESATKSLTRAQANLRSTGNELSNTQVLFAAATGDRTVLTEAVAALQFTHNKLSDEIDSLNQRMQKLAQQRLAWSRRYQIAAADRNNTDHEVWGQLKSIQKETNAVLDELEPDLRAQISKMRDVRNSLSSVIKKAEAAAQGPPEVVFQINVQQKQIEETLKIYEKNLILIDTSRRVHEKLLDEIGLTVDALTPKAIALGVWYQAKLIWNHELDRNRRRIRYAGQANHGAYDFHHWMDPLAIYVGPLCQSFFEAVPTQQRCHVGDPFASFLQLAGIRCADSPEHR